MSDNQQKVSHPTAIKEPGTTMQMVTFAVGDQKFAVDILKVKEIIRLEDITPVPNTPEYVAGVINLRGQVIPIVDLHVRLGLPMAEPTRKSRIITLSSGGKIVGFIVDMVHSVMRVDAEKVHSAPGIIPNLDSRFITALAAIEEQMILVLDSEKLLHLEASTISSSHGKTG